MYDTNEDESELVMVTRRTIAAISIVICWLGAARAEVRSLSILHTNDVHAHLLPSARGQGGFAELATAIRQERARSSGCLVLNAGDLVQGTPVSTIYRGVPVYEIANLLGFDAATLGNHEFDYGWQTTQKFLQIARYPVVAANVVDAGGSLMTRHPYVILTANGVRVAVIGLLTEDMRRLTTASVRGPWRVLPVIETLRRYVAEVRNKSDLIVVLGHLVEREEHAILTSVPEVAISVTGHAHNGMSAETRLDGRGVVRVKGYGEELGRLDLQVDMGQKKLASWDWKRIAIDRGKFTPAADVAREVRRWEGGVTRAVDKPIGESQREFTRAELRHLIERIMAEEMKTDFAFLNSGAIRNTLPRGKLVARHIWNIMPFDNIVVVGRMKGRQLPAALTAGRTVDPDREYTLATTDFTAANQAETGHLGTSGLTFSEDGPLLRDMLITWIERKKVVE
jgi:5'-nucleotidase / UDP-sugar diphosphatase